MFWKFYWLTILCLIIFYAINYVNSVNKLAQENNGNITDLNLAECVHHLNYVLIFECIAILFTSIFLIIEFIEVL